MQKGDTFFTLHELSDGCDVDIEPPLTDVASRSECPSAVVVLGGAFPRAAIELLQRAGVTLIFAPHRAEPLSLPEIGCVVVCTSNSSGPGICARLRDDPAWAGVPIVLLTAEGEPTPHADRTLPAGLGAPALTEAVLSLLAARQGDRRPPQLTETGRFRVVVEAARELFALSKPADTLALFFERLSQQLGADLYLNYLADESSGQLKLVHHGGLSAKELGELGLGPVRPADLMRLPGLRAYASFPLVSDGRQLGSVTFGSRTRASFAGGDLEMMREIAGLVGEALGRARLLEVLEESAHALSHDLQEPLQAISIFTDVLDRRYGSQMGDEAAELLGHIRAGTRRMEEMMQAVLRISGRRRV